MPSAAFVEFRLRTGSGRLFQADGPAMAKARGGLTRRVGGIHAVEFAQRNGDVLICVITWGGDH